MFPNRTVRVIVHATSSEVKQSGNIGGKFKFCAVVSGLTIYRNYYFTLKLRNGKGSVKIKTIEPRKLKE